MHAIDPTIWFLTKFSCIFYFAQSWVSLQPFTVICQPTDYNSELTLMGHAIVGSSIMCACEAAPVSRTGFSKDLPEQLWCLENGRELDTRHYSTPRTAVRSMDRGIASGAVIPKGSIKSTTSGSLPTITQGREGSQKFDPRQIQEMIRLLTTLRVALRPTLHAELRSNACRTTPLVPAAGGSNDPDRWAAEDKTRSAEVCYWTTQAALFNWKRSL
jgi:hypothetical protein